MNFSNFAQSSGIDEDIMNNIFNEFGFDSNDLDIFFMKFNNDANFRKAFEDRIFSNINISKEKKEKKEKKENVNNVKEEVLEKVFSDILNSLGIDKNEFNKFKEESTYVSDFGLDDKLNSLNDEELNNLVQEKGLEGACEYLFKDGFDRMEESEKYTKPMNERDNHTNQIFINKIKKGLEEDIEESYLLQGLSDELNDYINIKRATFIFEIGRSFKVDEDDRLGVNLDNLLANFSFGEDRDIDRKKGIEKALDVLSNEKYKSIGEFLVRIPESHLKVFIYYLGINSLDQFLELFLEYDKNIKNIQKESNKVFDKASEDKNFFKGRFKEDASRDFYYLGLLGPKLLEKVIIQLNIQTTEDLNKLLYRTHYFSAFVICVNPHILDYILDLNNIDTVDKFIDFFRKEKTRNKLLEISIDGIVSSANMLVLMKKFNINLNEINSFGHGIKALLNKSTPENLIFLVNLSTSRNIQEFDKYCRKRFIIENIESVDYSSLGELFEILGIEDKNIIEEMIEKSYDGNFSLHIKLFLLEIKKYKNNLGNLKEYILPLLISNTNIGHNLKQLGKAIKSLSSILKQPGASNNIDFSRLNDLSEYMNGRITAFLFEKIIFAESINQSFSSWDDEIKLIREGNFDYTNELHINLEYKKFNALSREDDIHDYMYSRYDVDSFMSIFSKENTHKSFDERELFEIECVAYEAKILKDYILNINEKAKQIGKKVLVVPNLTYGYLPGSVIIDDLNDENIEFLMGVKVGSTEYHKSGIEINSSLFKGARDKILNEQPIIIIIDGTSNLGNEENIRYADSYKGYLNHIIAMNYMLGKNDLEKIDYSNLGKSKEDIKLLINNFDFNKTVEIYSEILNNKDGKDFYSFNFWNTSKGKLNEKKEDGVLGPKMIFTNVGVRHDDLPDNLKNNKNNFKHIPAFFDDSGKIVNFEYGFDNTGIKIVNNIEVELQKAYGIEKASSSEHIATIINYSKDNVYFGE